MRTDGSCSGLATVAVALVLLAGCASVAPPPPQGVESKSARGWQPAGQAEYEAASLSCMQERGWEGELLPGGGIQFAGIPTAQQPHFDADSAECDELVEWTGVEAPLSEPLFTLNYQRVAAAHRCLMDHGLPVEPLPSFQQWRDRLEANDDYVVASAARDAELTGGRGYSGQVEQDCPDPDGFFYDVTTRIYPDAVDYDAYEAAT